MPSGNKFPMSHVSGNDCQLSVTIYTNILFSLVKQVGLHRKLYYKLYNTKIYKEVTSRGKHHCWQTKERIFYTKFQDPTLFFFFLFFWWVFVCLPTVDLPNASNFSNTKPSKIPYSLLYPLSHTHQHPKIQKVTIRIRK